MRPFRRVHVTAAALAVVALASGMSDGAARFGARLRTPSPDGHKLAEVRLEPAGEALWVGGDRCWRGAHVTSELVWSRRGDAVAFVADATTLVVVLVPDGAQPATLTWPVPAVAQPARAVAWLGPTSV